MVCIAAFIILALLGVFVAALSIFNRDIGKRYWQTFKKAWGCVWKKLRLQKCETSFKDDIKNSMLRKVVLKNPALVKPLSVLIEIGAVLIVIITVWALLTAIKSLLALQVFGTCNVFHPSACSLTSDICYIEAEPLPGSSIQRWFSEWQEIFAALPDSFKTWHAEDYLTEPYAISQGHKPDKPLALDILDPMCAACIRSYRRQLETGFFEQYNTVIMVYPIKASDGTYKYPNSELFTRYFYAISLVNPQVATDQLLHKLLTDTNADGINYQTVFAQLDPLAAETLLQSWLHEFGFSDTEVTEIISLTSSEQVLYLIQDVSAIVEQKIHAKNIPTLIYKGRKHHGAFQ